MTTLNYHFSGVAGAGMNPLARLMRSARAPRAGVRPRPRPGADAGDRGPAARRRHRARAAGWRGDRRGPRPLRVLDGRRGGDARVRAARALGIPMLPRPALLAELVNAGRPGVAISGTCGKSTVTGLVAWLVEAGGRSATVIGGAPRDRRGHRRRALGRARGRPDDRRDVRVGRDPHRLSAGSRRHPQHEPRPRRALFAARAVRHVRRAVRPAPRQCRLPGGRRARPRGRAPAPTACAAEADFPCASSRRARIVRAACSAARRATSSSTCPCPDCTTWRMRRRRRWSRSSWADRPRRSSRRSRGFPASPAASRWSA